MSLRSLLFTLALLGMGALAVTQADPSAPAPYTEAQAERGQDAYTTHCSVCHGATLEGGTHFPPLIGVRFWERWEGRSAWELFEYTHANMPLGAGGSLPDETYADILAFQLSQYGYPAGDTELTPDEAVLSDITLEPHTAE